jgi:hypothetical protein
MTSDHSRDMSFNILLTCLDFWMNAYMRTMK